ncbi:MAG: nucleoside deaminase [Deltaproteobacteria bacterium]|nr:nucleoside deaminase [Deltaproteobacteria bacterium]
MRRALELADAAARQGDVPVGAVVVDPTGQIVGEGQNRREIDADPSAHAEIVALRQAATKAGRWRLDHHRLYVTLEPCVMCAGALVNARVSWLIYGCDDPKAGAVRSLFALCEDPRLNHRLEVTRGVLKNESSSVLSAFFSALRQNREP